MKKSKVLAWLMAASLGAASLGSTAYAASFTEYLDQNLEQAMASFAEGYEAGAAAAQQSDSGKVDLNVRLGQGGKAMLGMMVPVDLSWINDANLSVGAASIGQLMYGDMTLSLNSAELLTVLYEMNMEDMQFYMQVPVLSDAVLKADYVQLLEMASQQSGTDSISTEQVKEVMQVVKNLSENPPSAEVMQTLLKRYMDIIFTAYADGETYQEIVTAGELSKQATVLEGIITQEAAQAMAVDLLTAAQSDEELKGIILQAVKGTSFEAGTYEQLQQMIGQALETVSQPIEGSDGSVIVLKFYLDEESNIIGQEMGMRQDEYEMPLFTWKGIEQDGTWAFAGTFNADSAIYVEGNGTIENDWANGVLTVNVDATPVVSVEISQMVNKELMKTGVFHGSYTVKPIIPEVPADSEQSSSSSPMSMLQNMALSIALDAEGTTGQCELGVMMSGTPLGYVTLSTEQNYTPEYAGLSTASNVINILDEEQMNAFAQTLDPQALLAVATERLTLAGMPEGFIENLMAQTGAGSMIEEGTVEDSMPAESESAPAEQPAEVPAPVDDPAEAPAESEPEETVAGSTAGGSIGTIGGAAAPAVAPSEETTEEETMTGLLDWNNNH